MKFIQLCGGIEVGGVSTFMIEFGKALKMAGHEVKVYYCQSDKKMKTNLLPGVEQYDYSDKMLEELNSADYILIHALIGHKKDPEYVNAFNHLIRNQITTKKVLFLNGHSIHVYKFYGLSNFDDPNYLSSFDYFCTFDDNNEISIRIKRTIGKEEYNKKYVHLHHPYFFSDDIKKNWVKFEDKHPRVTYIGRYAYFKHPEQIQHLHKLAYKDFEFEMRGIDRSIGSASVPDLFYEIDTENKYNTFKDSIKGPSKYTTIISNTWKKQHNIDLSDNMIDYPRNERMMVFGTYERQEGLDAMAKSMFGVECYRLKKANQYGDNIEYCMFEIVENGTIPIFDEFTAKSVYLYKDAKKTNQTLYDLGLGLFLAPDMSNVDQIIKQMNELKNDKEKYNELREKCWKYYKEHCNPLAEINNFVQQMN